ncbi:MAG: InlB B-repeat-containing protein, partial [Acholeplasmatales bacterium]|nr:InlB B-repeat-containing protein [Acholeplasmatales bacterium]
MKKLLVLLLLVFGATILVACQKKWTVSFDVDGGTPKVESQIVFDGKYATEPTAPTKNGSVFQGWRAGNTDFDFANTQIKANITLTANWKDTTPVLSHESLNVSINYKLNDHVSTLSSISWVGNSPYVSSVDGLTYNKGDLLPVWKYISEKLNVDL